MKRIQAPFALVLSALAFSALALFALGVAPADANTKKIKVDAAGVSETMEIKISTVDAKTVTDAVTETVPIELSNADVANPAAKAAAIVLRINAVAGNVTAAVDPVDASIVVITSNAGRTISRVEPRPLKTTERDRLVAAITPPETPGDAVVLGFQLEGTGSQDGTAAIAIGGLVFAVPTSLGEPASSVLGQLEALIDPDPTYDAEVVGDELRIVGSVLGNDYSAFVSDAEPGDTGFSYGFSLESFPTPISLPPAGALLAIGALSAWARRGRRPVS